MRYGAWVLIWVSVGSEHDDYEKRYVTHCDLLMPHCDLLIPHCNLPMPHYDLPTSYCQFPMLRCNLSMLVVLVKVVVASRTMPVRMVG
jgi:hypothetical protein